MDQEIDDNGVPTPYAVIQNLIQIMGVALMNIETEIKEINRFGKYGAAHKYIKLWRADAQMRKEKLLKMLEGK